ncbi:4-phosphoerythronate dehydrogenase [Rubrivirga sp.]|uniref:4-phosphoerythronate dehydrogenase n=1 Tax=Rubrivirga sp. TaxID=1885344 RepID=UPI003C723395
MLTIVADENIPHVTDAIGSLGHVHTVPGRPITRGTVLEADALLVRSVTRVDADLLEGTAVRFVGSATAGTDHVDPPALEAAGIAFASAPGSNAASVVDYVLASVLAVASDQDVVLDGKTLGIVGAGHVGGRLAPRARALGFEVVVCDPPRAEAGFTDHDYLSLDAVLEVADIVTLHTPFTDDGPHPTRSLFDLEVVDRMKTDAWLVNAARGGVLEVDAALALATTRPVVLDVWPGEPEPDPALVQAAALATPHIAGYALDAKVRGTAMVANALRAWAGEPRWDVATVLPDPVRISAPSSRSTRRDGWLDEVAQRAYDVRADDARFRSALEGVSGERRAAAFSDLRKHYPARRELSRVVLEGAVPASLVGAVTVGLGLQMA